MINHYITWLWVSDFNSLTWFRVQVTPTTIIDLHQGLNETVGQADAVHPTIWLAEIAKYF